MASAVAEIEDDGLEDVSPKHHQRSELADKPEGAARDNQIGGEVVKLRTMTFHHDDCVAGSRLNDEQLIELLIDVGRVNAQTGEGWEVCNKFWSVFAPRWQKYQERCKQQQTLGADSGLIYAMSGASR